MDNNNINPQVNPEAESPVIEMPGEIPQINTIDPINPIETPVVSEAFVEPPAAVVEPAGNIEQQTFNFGAPQAAYAPAVETRTANGDGLAVAGFVTGLSSLVLGVFSSMGLICVAAGIVGIVLCAIAKKKGVSDGFSKAGMTLSIIGLILSLIFTISCMACRSVMMDNVTEYFDGTEFAEIIESGDTEALTEFFEQFMLENGFEVPEDGFTYVANYSYDFEA